MWYVNWIHTPGKKRLLEEISIISSSADLSFYALMASWEGF